MMLGTMVSSSLIFSNQRSTIQKFPESVRKHWIEWELRSMILISLFLQILLLFLGNRRKYKAGKWIRATLWVAYNTAGSFATVPLGILSKEFYDSSKQHGSSKPHYIMIAFWAPFLLLHLGGPDTITAYALEDNELWTRDFPNLFVQFSVAFLVFLKSWASTSLNYLAIPIFVSGLIKYVERIWVQWSASKDHFRDSLLPRPDPGPNYAKFMGEYSSKKSQGYIIELERVPNVAPTLVDNPHRDAPAPAPAPVSQDDAFILHNAYSFFNTFKLLFADLILSFQDRENSVSVFRNISYNDAFRVIEVELGFMFDVLFTKAAFVHQSVSRCILRLITFCCNCSVFVLFLIIDKNKYSGVDLVVTYVLLSGAVFHELYSLLLLLFCSDWTKIQLNKPKLNPPKCVAFLFPSRKKKWSNSMAQYNLISFCLKDKTTKCSRILKYLLSRIPKGLFIYEFIEKYRYEDVQVVSPDLKKLVFEQLLEKSMNATDISVCKNLCAFRGDQALKEMNTFDELGWSVVDVEFDQSILLWHIATDLCYYTDKKKDPQILGSCKISKLISDYMLYLLVMCPFMLPNGIGQIIFQDTCAEAIEFFQDNQYISDSDLACEMLLHVNTEYLPIEVKGDRTKSVLFDACRLAKCLDTLKTEGGQQWEIGEKWKMISHVWVEMLSYAANQCRSNYHAKQLGIGGELLTHVWFLMAHLGITEDFQISEGHARAKLILS